MKQYRLKAMLRINGLEKKTIYRLQYKFLWWWIDCVKYNQIGNTYFRYKIEFDSAVEAMDFVEKTLKNETAYIEE